MTTRVSTNSSGNEANEQSDSSSISADGRYVVFRSNASNLVPSDTNGTFYIFIKDTQNEAVSRISTSSSGTQANFYSREAAISADGRYVAYESFATNLVSGDSNGTNDIFLATIDATSPANSISSSTHASSSSYYPNKNSSFSWSATDNSGITGHSYALDQSALTDPDEVNEGLTTSANYNGLADGTWYFHLRAVDIFNNWSSTSHFTINIDTTAPQITFSALDYNKYYRGVVNLSAISTDSLSGLDSTQFYQGDNLLGSSNLPAASIAWDASNINGTVALTAKATDQVGNEQSAAAQTIKIDNTKPKTLAPYQRKVKKRKKTKLYYKVEDTYSDNKAYVVIRIKKNNKLVKIINLGLVNINVLQYVLYKATLPKGIYRYYISAKDQAGNTQANVAHNYLVIKS